ncbi:MAG: molybdate ABC transporter substrate-binding protein [Dehalococcoidia bacterium]|nr:molybdate ABC transporter substrate-binding protein [Dehalococcoidia bacterium]
MTKPAWVALLVVLLGSALLAASCGNDDGTDGSQDKASATTPDPSLTGEITVLAASSLTEALEDVGKQFEAAHPGARVRFSFAASSALATQIEEGGPGDLFASADQAQVDRLQRDIHVGPSDVFARNEPVVVVPKGSSTVVSFEDLAKGGVRLVLAGPEVPIGKYARQVLENASAPGGIDAAFSQRVLDNVRSEESNVRAVLAKVQLGEADAGIVYATDVAAAGGEVERIDIPPQFNVVAEYPVAISAHAVNKPLAAAFVEFLLSDKGQEVMEAHGFKGK